MGNKTQDTDYYRYYLDKYNVWWRFLLPWEVPFKYMARKICKGRVLDVGCGPGRYLSFLADAIGIDHNPEMVNFARSRGFMAYTSDEFAGEKNFTQGSFDTILFAHVIEHMSFSEACNLISAYRSYLKPNGRIVLVVPQGRAYRNDHTHVCYFDDQAINKLAEKLQLHLTRTLHHPFPRQLSEWISNDAIYICKLPELATAAVAHR